MLVCKHHPLRAIGDGRRNPHPTFPAVRPDDVRVRPSVDCAGKTVAGAPEIKPFDIISDEPQKEKLALRQFFISLLCVLPLRKGPESTEPTEFV